jgi:hypothetical protein
MSATKEESDYTHEESYSDDAAIKLDIGAKNNDIGEAGALKLTKDGHVCWDTGRKRNNKSEKRVLTPIQTVLVPQPSNDPNDPLNWSWWKKHLILLTIGVSAFVADFQAAPPCILVQSVEWNITPNHVNEANNLYVLMM